MKKYIAAILVIAAINTYSCENTNTDRTDRHTDSLGRGNMDSSGSQPMQTSPNAANGGNATDTLANRNGGGASSPNGGGASTPTGGGSTPRTDSVVRH